MDIVPVVGRCAWIGCGWVAVFREVHEKQQGDITLDGIGSRYTISPRLAWHLAKQSLITLSLGHGVSTVRSKKSDRRRRRCKRWRRACKGRMPSCGTSSDTSSAKSEKTTTSSRRGTPKGPSVATRVAVIRATAIVQAELDSGGEKVPYKWLNVASHYPPSLVARP